MAGETELLLRIGADLRQWEAGLKRTEKGAEGFKSRFQKFSRTAGAKLSSAIFSPLAGLVGGAAILKATHDLVQFDSALTRLAIQGKVSSEEQIKLKKAIMDTSIASGQSRENVLGGLNAIVERTGDLDFARAVMNDMAVASTATGAAMADLGALASNLQQKMGLASGEIMDAFNVLTVQGKAGAFTLENMATMGERLFSAAARFGVKGKSGIQEFGALVQVARMGTGSSEQATTAIEGAMADIIAKQKEIRNLAGFDIFKSGTKDIKDVSEVFKGIIAGTGGDATKLQKIFGRESIRGISTLANAYKETKGFALFDKLMQGGDPSEIMNDFARYSQSAAHQFNILKAVGADFADSALSSVLAKLSDTIKSITSDPAKMKAISDGLREVGAAMAQLTVTAGQLAANPVAEALLINPVKAIGAYSAYSDWIEAAGDKKAREETKRTQIETGFNTMPADERKKIMARINSGEKVSLEREVMQFQTRQKIANTVNIKVEMQSDGRVVTSSDTPDTTVNPTAPRGVFAYD